VSTGPSVDVSPAEQLRRASEVARVVNLKSLRMSKIRSEVGLSPAQSEPVSIELMLMHRSGVRRAEGATLSSGQRIEPNFLVVVDFKSEGLVKDAPPAFVVECQFELIYTAEDVSGFDNQHLRAFADLNGVYNAWPFWREVVASVTSRMGLTGITLPLYRPAATPKKSEE
jgi:hypothetical protein